MKYLLFAFVTLASSAQVFTLGAPADQYCSPAACAFPAGNANAPPASRPCSAVWTDPSMPLPTLVYGYSGDALHCAFPAPNGPAIATLSFSEPTKTASGQRVFSVSLNGSQLGAIDVFKMAGGAKKRLDLPPTLVTVSDGALHVDLVASLGSPVISQARIDALPQGPPGSQGVQGPAGPQGKQGDVGPAGPSGVARWMINPQGIEYVELRRSDGTIARRFAVGPDSVGLMAIPDANPAGWTPVAP